MATGVLFNTHLSVTIVHDIRAPQALVPVITTGAMLDLLGIAFASALTPYVHSMPLGWQLGLIPQDQTDMTPNAFFSCKGPLLLTLVPASGCHSEHPAPALPPGLLDAIMTVYSSMFSLY